MIVSFVLHTSVEINFWIVLEMGRIVVFSSFFYWSEFSRT